MRLLCFQAKRFWWKTYSKSIPEVEDRDVEEKVQDGLIVFYHVEPQDETESKRGSVLRQSLKHIKWLANKKKIKTIVLHSFAHLGGKDAPPAFAQELMDELAQRLRDTDYEVHMTPFGYFYEWNLKVYGDSLAKVWKEI